MLTHPEDSLSTMLEISELQEIVPLPPDLRLSLVASKTITDAFIVGSSVTFYTKRD
jgi:hypothetical protein